MGRIYRQGKILRDERGNPMLGADGKPKWELRSRKWWIHYYDANGKACYESSGSTKKGAAERLLRLREGAKERGEAVGPHIGRITFDEAAADVVNDYVVNGRRSLGHVRRRIELHLKPVFSGKRMTSITTADVRSFTAARMQAGASAAEINRELAIVKRAFRLALQAGKLLHVPYVPMLRERNVRQGFFEREQFESVRANLPEYLKPVITFAYVTGWRVLSEVLPLRLGQVDLQAGAVRLEAGTTKNSEARLFKFGAITDLRDTLRAQLASAERLSRETGRIVTYVFHEPDGSPVNENRFRKAWRAACRAAGCPGRIPHDFRRTAVRNLVRAGVPERVAMQMTGHKTRSVFERYNITSEGDLNEAAEKLEAFLTARPAETRTARVQPFKSRA